MNLHTVDHNAYNRFVNLDNIEFRVIDFLAKSQNKHANNLFKMLYYDTEDCLQLPALSYEQKMGLLYITNGDASTERIFMAPYVDDAFEHQGAHLHIYIRNVAPMSHITSTVSVGFELIVHNKINNIFGDADEDNPMSNPSELADGGEPIIIYKSRATTMLKSLLSALNGEFVAGVGTL